MNVTASATVFPDRRDWRGAFVALRRLLGQAGDTTQVFRIMRALNAGTARKNFERLVSTVEGGRIAYGHIELAERFSDPAYIASFPKGSVGAAYRDFLELTGYSAMGLAEVSRSDDGFREAAHPYAWFGRRMRDLHDVWHVLTGYKADDPLGEACLVAFSYAQSGGLGWALIATGVAFKALSRGEWVAARAIWEGYRRGKVAAWLPGEDVEALLAEPLYQARGRLGLAAPLFYRG